MQLPWDPRLPFSDPIFGDSKSYVADYNKNNSRPLSYHTVGASACITTYVEAMRKAGSIDPAEVRKALAATDIVTAFGPVKFSPDGDGDAILMGAKLGQVQKGEVEIVFPTATKTADLIYPTPTWAKKV
jgi:branched-chain amino acid transport system substrate-binding protein